MEVGSNLERLPVDVESRSVVLMIFGGIHMKVVGTRSRAPSSSSDWVHPSVFKDCSLQCPSKYTSLKTYDQGEPAVSYR